MKHLLIILAFTACTSTARKEVFTYPLTITGKAPLTDNKAVAFFIDSKGKSGSMLIGSINFNIGNVYNDDGIKTGEVRYGKMHGKIGYYGNDSFNAAVDTLPKFQRKN